MKLLTNINQTIKPQINMRNLLLLFKSVLLVLILTVTSCQKSADDVSSFEKDENENYYKEKLDKLLLLQKVEKSNVLSSNKGSKSSKADGEFASYKEAYLFFSTLIKDFHSTATDTLYRSEKSEDNSITAKGGANNAIMNSSNTDVLSFSSNASNVATVSNTFGTAHISVSYSVALAISFGYTYMGASKYYYTAKYTTNTASALSVSYSGMGSAVPSPYLGITPGSNGSGTLSGNMEGDVTIAGTTFSFFISLSGGYTATQPPVPTTILPTSIFVTHTFYASAH